ncbi:MAG: hypothetical protein A2X32_08080 [Elusimicrobia bacterium GWC2_64_44]|nr:MAG: hypothetical protein A2X32_08080 [Elusimicrobia bacterium GWC2_64_44]
MASGVGTTRYSGGNGGRGRDNNTGQGGPGGSSAGTGANGTSGAAVWTTVTAAAPPAGGGIGGNGGPAGYAGYAPASGYGGGGGGGGDVNPIVGGDGAPGLVTITYAVPEPVTPAASAVYLSSIDVTWTQIGSEAGYLVEASTAANFTGTISSTETGQGNISSMTVSVPQLSSNTVYYIRVGSLWGNATAYAASFATATLSNLVENPQIYGVFVTSVTANWLPRPASPLSDSCSGYILQASPNPDFSAPVYSSVTKQGVSVTTLTVTGLSTFIPYYIRFGTLNNAYYVPNYYSTGTVATPSYRLPAAPSVSAVHFSSIAVTWGPVNSAAGYLVQASTAADFTGTVSSTMTTNGALSGLTVSAPQLSSNTVYNIRVGSLWGNATAYATSFATATLSNLVVNPRIYGVFNSSITANWLPRPSAPLSNSCSGYVLEASPNPDFSPPVYSSATTDGVAVTTLSVISLPGAVQYYVRYGTLNNEYFTPNYYSTGAVVTTLVPVPFDHAASAVYFSSIPVTWTSVDSLAGYIVQASTAANFTGTIHSSATTIGTLTGLTVSVPQLSSNTVYNIRTGSLWGNATGYATYFATTTLANLVENPLVYGVFTTSITANWLPRPAAPASDSCSGYILQASPNPDFSAPVFSSVTTQGVDVTTLTLVDLSSSTRYYLRYGALNSVQYVPNYYSTGAVVVTIAPPPDTPAVSAVYLSSMDVTWTQIDSRAGYIVEASTASDFTGAISSSKTVLGLSALSVQAPQLSSNTVYNIRVGSLWGNATGYSPAVAAATLANIPVNPRLYAVFQDSVTANWLPRPAAPLSNSCSGYIFQADTDPDFTAPYSTQTTQGPIAVTTLTLTGMDGGTEYYFRFGTLNNTDLTPNYYSTGTVATTRVRDWGSTLVTIISSGIAQAGATGWINAANIRVADAAYARAPIGNVQASTVTNYSFNIPPQASILGIRVHIKGYSAGTKNLTVSLTKNGATAATPTKNLTLPAANAVVIAGAAGDTWGTLWTPSDINSPSFGVIVKPVADTAIQYYDWAGIQVYYSVPPPQDTAVPAVYLSSITLSWTPVESTAGYLVQASTAANFTGTLFSSQTLRELSALTLTAPQLSSNTVYNIRVGSLWGSATNYATALTTATLANIAVNPRIYGVFVTSVTANWLPRPSAPLSDSCSGYILQADTDPGFSAPISSRTTQGSVAVTTLTVSGLTEGTQYYFRFGTLNNAHFTPNYYSTGTVSTTHFAFVNCDLRYSPDGISVVSFACEHPSEVTSPLRIYKAPNVYGIVLVDPLNPDATKIMINTNSGVRAVRKYP